MRLLHRDGLLMYEALTRLTGMVRPKIAATRLSGLTRRFVHSRNTAPTFGNCSNCPTSLYASIGSRIIRKVPSPGIILHSKSVVSISYKAFLGNFINSSTCAFTMNRVSSRITVLLGAAQRSLFGKVRVTIRNEQVNSVNGTIRACYRDHNCSIIHRVINRKINHGVRRSPRIPGCNHHKINPVLGDNVAVYVRPVVGLNEGRLIFRDSK